MLLKAPILKLPTDVSQDCTSSPRVVLNSKEWFKPIYFQELKWFNYN